MTRTLVVLALGLVLAASNTTALLAMTAARHECRPVSHDCGQTMLKSCCCEGSESGQPLGQPSSTSRTTVAGLETAAAASPAWLMVNVATVVVSGLAGLPPHAPPHGYPIGDLPILLSVLLI